MNKSSTILILLLLLLSVIATVHAAYYRDARYRPLTAGTQIEMVRGRESLGRPSIGFPAYIEFGELRYYGIVTTSHVGDKDDSVYQPTFASDNYIGFIYVDGIVGDPTKLVDVAFVFTETMKKGDTPKTVYPWVITNVSITGYHAIIDYVKSDDEINQVVNIARVIKVGRTTGTTSGVICSKVYFMPTRGYVFRVDFRAEWGDSGGIIHQVIRIIKPDYPADVKTYGVVIGLDPGTGHMLSAPANRITSELRIVFYLLGG